jgi:hypothetical protein
MYKLKMSKIALCTLSFGESYKHSVRYGRQNKVEYCKKNNYDLIEDESVVDSTRKLQWGKIKLLEKYLSNYDYLVWVDADTYITSDTTLEDIIKKLDNYDMMYEKDPFIWVNTGFMVLKNCNFCKELLEECYKHLDKICYDQGSIDYLYRNNWNNSQNHIKILEHSEGLNQYWNSWKVGDFLIHFPGCKEPQLKTNALELMMNKFCPLKMEEEDEETFLLRKEWLKGEVNNYIENEWRETRKENKWLPRDVYD